MNLSRPTYHFVSHTHWDREWYRPAEGFRVMLVGMVDRLLELLRSEPSFASFTLDGQAIILEDYLEIRPERGWDIRSMVENGRLFIGPWYVLADEFLSSGESIIRNLLAGGKLAASFGGAMQIGYLPDTFGHVAMMPAILKGFGIDCAVTYRGFGGEPGQTTSEYHWKSPDGSGVLMLHLPRDGYSGAYFHGMSEDEIAARFSIIKEELDERATTSERLVLNGGDHHWPDESLARTLAFLRGRFDCEFIHSDLPAYVKALRSRLPSGTPEVSGELRSGYRYAFSVLGGVYSSRVYLKQANWASQALLERYAEPLNSLAVALGAPSGAASLRHAYKLLLSNQAHDSICGCSIDSVHRMMMARFEAVKETADAVIGECLSSIIPGDEREAGDDTYLFFFNPSPFARTDVAAAECRFFLQDVVVGLNPGVKAARKLTGADGFNIIDEFGNRVPYQVTGRKEGYDLTVSRHGYPRQTRADIFSLLVDANNVPPVGFKGFRIVRKNGARKFRPRVRAGKYFLENDFLRVSAKKNGALAIEDLSTGRRYRGLNVFEDTGDAGDEYNYSPPRKDRSRSSAGARAGIEILEKGPLRAAMRISLGLRVPLSLTGKARSKETVTLAIDTVVSLDCYSRSVVIETTVKNAARDHRLRVLFPSGVDAEEAYADSQFCVVRRPRETRDVSGFTIEHPASVAPMQRFVTVRGEGRALTLLSYGIPEYELTADGTLALTLLRCVGTLAGEDLITRPGGKSGWHNETPEAQCQGTHTFRYALFPCAPEEFNTMDLVNEQAEKFHYPLLSERRKNEKAPAMAGSLLSCSSRSAVLSTVKESEDGGGFIVRWWNPLPRRITNTLTFMMPMTGMAPATLDEKALTGFSPGRTQSVASNTCEITTIRIEKGT